MMAWRQMRRCSATECQGLDAGIVGSGNDVRREVLNGSRLKAGQEAWSEATMFGIRDIPVHQGSRVNTWPASHALVQALP